MPKGLGRTTVKSVMDKFKAGNLKSGSGAKVKSRAQAIAIGIHEGYPQGYSPKGHDPKRSKSGKKGGY